MISTVYPPEIDLSRNKSLRTLEVETFFTHPMDPRCLPCTLLTTKCPVSHNTIIVYRDGFKRLWSDVTKDCSSSPPCPYRPYSS